jgi:hypothetical protein
LYASVGGVVEAFGNLDVVEEGVHHLLSQRAHLSLLLPAVIILSIFFVCDNVEAGGNA